MMASKSMKVLNIIAGVLLIVAGIYCLCNQDIAAMTAGVMVGIFMLLSGVIEIVVFATTSGLLFGSGWLLLDGVLLKNGTVQYGCGGGLCQLSNLIFWMTLHTPLEGKERHRHGYDVFPDSNRTQPFGSGATCFYPYGDLMIYNPTDRPFQLRLRVGETDLEGEWRSDRPPQFRYQIVERHHEMRHEWWGGCSRHNELYLQVFDLEGELLEDRLVVENHAMMMYTPFLEDNAPDGGREEEEK